LSSKTTSGRCYQPGKYWPVAHPIESTLSNGTGSTMASGVDRIYATVVLRSTSGWMDHSSAVPCPNYFCAQTTEANLSSFIQNAYGPRGSNQPDVDYLIWTMWNNVNPYVGGLVRADGSDKNEGM